MREGSEGGRAGPRLPRARAALSWAGICAAVAWAFASPAASGLPSRPPVSRIPKSIVVSTTGEHPNVLVDQIGTAHVVWNQSTAQGAPDVLHYCRIPRGATRCQDEQ